MIDIKDYYDEVLSKFNFSISGYTNIEKNLNDFFAHFVNSRSLIGKNHIDFISYGYSKLIDLDKWKLETTHNDEFFFNTFNERSSELLMVHEYYSFKHFLKKECSDSILDIDFSDRKAIEKFLKVKSKFNEVSNYLGFAGEDEIKSLIREKRENDDNSKITKSDVSKHLIDSLISKTIDISDNDRITASKISTSELAAKIFRKPTVYRIALIEEGHLEVRFDKHLGVLTIKIPFSELFSGNYKEAKHNLHKSFEEELLKVEKDSKVQLLFTKNDNLYNKTNLEIPYLFVQNLNILNSDTVKRTIKVLSEKLLSLNKTAKDKFFFEYDSFKIDMLIRSFSKLLLSHAYLSYLFNCWVENIPSVVDIDENTNDQRCLGTFILGYNMDQEISDSERTLFKITSDRISANLASNAIENAYPDIKLNRARKRQVNFLNTFRSDLEEEYNRIKNKSRESGNWISIHEFDLNLTKNWIIEYLNSRRKVLEECGLKMFIEYFQELYQNEANFDIALLTELNSVENANLASKNNIYKFKEDPNGVLQIKCDGINRSVINITIPHYLIEKFKDRIEIEEKDSMEKINTSIINNSELHIVCEMKKEELHFDSLIQSLEGKTRKSGGIANFIQNNWNEILIMGNIEIGSYNDDDTFISKINLKNDFSQKNGKLESNSEKLKDLGKAKELVWKIDYYSI